MGELSEALASSLGAAVRTKAPVRGLSRDRRWRVALDDDVVEADEVILACPAHAAAPLVEGLAPEIAAELRSSPFAAVTVACEAYDERSLAHPIEGFGVLIPRSEGVRPLGTLCSDRIFPAHAPRGTRLLRTLIGGALDPEAVELGDDATAALVHRGLEPLVGVLGAPRVRRLYRHPQAIAQYHVGHLDRVTRLERFARDVGLVFTGASYRGVSVNACVEDAFRVSASIVERLPESARGEGWATPEALRAAGK